MPDPYAEDGKEAAVIAEVAGGEEANLKYEWQLHELDLVSGQGSKRIVVKRRAMDTGTATVTVSGLPEGCANTAMETFAVVDYPGPKLVDEFGKLSVGNMKARIDNYCLELDQEPESIGYIQIGNNDTARAQSREILKYLNFAKKTALTRISFVFTTDDEDMTKLWVVRSVRRLPSFEDPVYVEASDNLTLRKFLASKGKIRGK